VGDEFSSRASLYGDSPDHVRGPDFVFMERFFRELGKIERALDVSSGAGHTAALLASFCQFVVALDISEGMLRETVRRYGYLGILPVMGDSENLPFEEGSFQVVTCRIAPHHFASVGDFLAEVRRVLASGGCAVVVDSTVPRVSFLDDFLNEMERLRDPTHVRSLTVSEWRDLIRDAGLTLAEEWTFRKRHDFESWLGRTRPSPEVKAKVRKMLLCAPDGVKRYLNLEVDQAGGIVSYEDEKTIFVLRKV